jgi:hypothetical protein
MTKDNLFQKGNKSQPKFSRGRWGIVIITLALLGILCSGCNPFSPSDPSATLNNFCDGYNSNNTQEVYDTLSGSAQYALDSNPDSLRGYLSSDYTCVQSSFYQKNSDTVGVVLFKFNTSIIISSNALSYGTALLKMIQQNGDWRIDQPNWSISCPDSFCL